MSDDHFRITYEGEALQNGLMDVRELAPALLSAGELIQTTNRLLNGDRAVVSLQVKSDFRRGSFDIGLLLNQNLIEAAKQFLQLHPHVKDAKDLLDLLFFYGGLPVSAGMGLFKFIKWLRGRNIGSAQMTFINNGIVQIQLGDDTVQVSEIVLRLAQEELVRKYAEGIVRPLKRDGIEELHVDGGEDRRDDVDKSDIAYFEVGFADGVTLLENNREAVLEITRLSFNPDHKWGFTDGTTKLRAIVKDNRFWSDIRSGLRFAKGDHVRVILRTRTFKNDADELKSEYSVEDVIQHIPRRTMPQVNLDL